MTAAVILTVGCEGCNKTTCVSYACACGSVARAARFHFHEMTWSTLRGWMQSLRCQGLTVKDACTRARSFTCDPGIPSRQFATARLRASSTKKRERSGEVGLQKTFKYISSLSLSPLPPPVRISSMIMVNNKIECVHLLLGTPARSVSARL